MAEKHTLEEIVGRIIDQWTQSTSFINAFSSRAPESSQFTRSVAQFIKTCMEEIADKRRLNAKRKEYQQRKSAALGRNHQNHPSPTTMTISESIAETAEKRKCKTRKTFSPKRNWVPSTPLQAHIVSPVPHLLVMTFLFLVSRAAIATKCFHNR